MNKLLGVGLPLAMLVTGGLWTQYQEYEHPVLTTSVSAVAENIAATDITTATYMTPEVTAAGTSASETPSSLLRFGSVNGIALSDDLKTIVELKGEPLSMIQDEIIKSSRTYLFKDCEINIVDGAVQSVTVGAAVGKVEIDGISFSFDKLKDRLGMPYFISEDGIVYKKGNMAFKIFMDPHDNHIKSVSYFHAGNQ
ncbi:hypothetical protein [Paenibacillus sp. FSL H7-0331]|uniref:hypothetical protein n=1 Tax=Paenibacillus sp. FSL H7-0331 TaxID=1920421 RepID=UPI00097005D8|nr:hypothetical protein [Paenibacillus sp. FSL H7-0331]OMF07255.1 hypothetical protein BK127_29630 [Paenibacillus sp. FSL H7-0331]